MNPFERAGAFWIAPKKESRMLQAPEWFSPQCTHMVVPANAGTHNH
jgi:hypothetical protein